MSDTPLVHAPVLVRPLLEYLSPQPGERVFDGTLGLGGHAEVLIQRIRPGGVYLGVDLDPRMLAEAQARVRQVDEVRLILKLGNYRDILSLLAEAGMEAADVMLLDLGVNSAQLDDAARGFSFDREGPLDMRFDPAQKESALDLVNRLSEEELADIFFHYGGEMNSRRVARRICQVRHTARISSTRVLAAAVEQAYIAAGAYRRDAIHPATKVFQALRVAVNRELENLEAFLAVATGCLSPGGRVAVISFHSLEDGIVKRAFREQKSAGALEELTKRPVVAEADERESNPRSRSAKLRVARRKA
jgi:16S rRNA (cytosine1402-N4)-methyltransferase